MEKENEISTKTKKTCHLAGFQHYYLFIANLRLVVRQRKELISFSLMPEITSRHLIMSLRIPAIPPVSHELFITLSVSILSAAIFFVEV